MLRKNGCPRYEELAADATARLSIDANSSSQRPRDARGEPGVGFQKTDVCPD